MVEHQHLASVDTSAHDTIAMYLINESIAKRRRLTMSYVELNALVENERQIVSRRI